jgi:hypothetical protein
MDFEHVSYVWIRQIFRTKSYADASDSVTQKSEMKTSHDEAAGFILLCLGGFHRPSGNVQFNLDYCAADAAYNDKKKRCSNANL